MAQTTASQPQTTRVARASPRQALEPGQAVADLRTLFRAIKRSPWAVIITDVHGNIVYINPKFTRLTGYLPEEVVGVNISALSRQSPEDRRLWETLRSGEVWEGEFHNRAKSGEEYWVRAYIFPWRDAQGVVTHFVGFNEDITEFKRAEQALRSSEERFRRLADAAMEGIAIHYKGRILDANQAFAEMFGYELYEVIGMHALDFTAPESRDLISRHLRSAYDRPFEATALRKDGTTFPAEVCGKAMLDQGRRVSVTAIRDISQRQRSEREAAAKERTSASRGGYTGQPPDNCLLGLSRREREVLCLVAWGLTNCQIARRLHISRRTVEHHISHALTKLDTPNRTAAVVAAALSGLLELNPSD